MTSSGWRTAHGAVVVGNAAAIRGHTASIDARVKEAIAAFKASDLNVAERVLRNLLERVPGHPDANYIFALVAERTGRYEVAEHHLLRCTAGADVVPDHWYALAVLLAERNRHAEALVPVREALALVPDEPRYLQRAGLSELALGKAEQAVTSLRCALESEPGNTLTRNALGNALRERNANWAALSQYAIAVGHNAFETMTYSNAGVCALELGLLSDSLALTRQALALDPFRPDLQSNFLLAQHYGDVPAPDDARLGALHRRYDSHALAAPRTEAPALRKAAQRLRVGLLSPDFRQHPVASFLMPLLQNAHDAGMHVICYYDAHECDERTEALRATAAKWRHTAGASNSEVRERMLADDLDVLVDLSGHTAANRLPLFALRAAPLQVSWLGYPFSTGLAGMDARLTDAISDPEPRGGELCSGYSETRLRMPGPFLCFEPPMRPASLSEPGVLDAETSNRAAPDTRAPSDGERRGSVGTRFISLNNLSKLSDATLRCWSRILAAVPGAVLVLKSQTFAEPRARATFRARMANFSIASEQLELHARTVSHEEHLRFYERADVALDTFPYNGTTTTCEALWMETPVVTLVGHTHAGRVGASLLHALELDAELATRDEAQYVERAVALALDHGRRARLSGELRARMNHSGLLDGASFARRFAQTLCRHHEQVRARHRANLETLYVGAMPFAMGSWLLACLQALATYARASGLFPRLDVKWVAQPDDTAVRSALTEGRARAVFGDLTIGKALAGYAAAQGRTSADDWFPYGEHCADDRACWMALPGVKLVQAHDIVASPDTVVTGLAQWLGLELDGARVQTVIAQAQQALEPAEVAALALSVPPPMAAFADLIERRKAPLAAFARAVSAVPCRLPDDAWAQLPPDITNTFTARLLAHGDWQAADLPVLRGLLGDGDYFVDLGAGHGTYALAAARAVGPLGAVVAVEPDLMAAARLTRAATIPGNGPLTVLHAAVSADVEHGTDAVSDIGTPPVEPLDWARLRAESGATTLAGIRVADRAARDYLLSALRTGSLAVPGFVLLSATAAHGLSEALLTEFSELGLSAHVSVPIANALRPWLPPATGAAGRSEPVMASGLFFVRQEAPSAIASQRILISGDDASCEQPVEPAAVATHTPAEVCAVLAAQPDDTYVNRGFADAWQASLADSSGAAPERAALVAALQHVVAARQPTLAPTQRYEAALVARRLLVRLVEGHPLQNFSLAAVDIWLGLPDGAIRHLRRLLGPGVDLPDPRDEPFVLPPGLAPIQRGAQLQQLRTSLTDGAVAMLANLLVARHGLASPDLDALLKRTDERVNDYLQRCDNRPHRTDRTIEIGDQPEKPALAKTDAQLAQRGGAALLKPASEAEVVLLRLAWLRGAAATGRTDPRAWPRAALALFPWLPGWPTTGLLTGLEPDASTSG
ncbi:MAG: tetratricopeptide repeat protein [Pseudomonadota bacterium]